MIVSASLGTVYEGVYTQSLTSISDWNRACRWNQGYQFQEAKTAVRRRFFWAALGPAVRLTTRGRYTVLGPVSPVANVSDGSNCDTAGYVRRGCFAPNRDRTATSRAVAKFAWRLPLLGDMLIQAM